MTRRVISFDTPILLLNVTTAEREKSKDFPWILVLVKYIRNEEKLDCVVEAFRVLGNLSRTKRIRDRLMKCEGQRRTLPRERERVSLLSLLVDRLAIHYSQSDNVELLYAVIGVLINLTVDEEKRECLKVHHGIDR